MPKVKYAPAARLDMKEIGRYTQHQWGKKQRNKYLRQLHNRANQLAEYPHLAKHYKELKGQPYGYMEGKHIIFFHIKKNGIEVIRVLHGSMDYKRHL